MEASTARASLTTFFLLYTSIVSGLQTAHDFDERGERCKGKVYSPVFGTVRLAEGRYKFVWGEHKGGVAYGSFIDSDQTLSNFAHLRVSTSSTYEDREQMYGAGLLEGYLTAERIYQNVVNAQAYFKRSLNMSSAGPVQWLVDQDQWVRQQIRSNSSSLFWSTLDLVLQQFDGLVAGYRARVEEEGDVEKLGNLTRTDLLFINGNGELYDVMEQYNTPDNRQQQRYSRMAAEELFVDLAAGGKCSALIKVASDLSSIYMGHSTWDTFTAMLRIFKHYHFNLQNSAIPMRRMSFSSYPGEIFSDDDFYMMDTNITVLQTTNKIFNESLFSLLTPRSVVSWQRVRVANFLSRSGSEWGAYLDMYNSGTYNNQYMVVDLNKFIPKSDLLPGLLWVVEQIPGLVRAEDMTNALWLGYWPSFNVPYFDLIYQQSMYPDFRNHTSGRGTDFDEPAKWLSIDVSPRAIIFRRDQGRVDSLQDMKNIMRYNNYNSDKPSKGHPLASICGRADLATSHALPKGCFDSKVTDYHMALNLQAEAVNGPTRSHGLPPFEWTDAWSDFTHQGQPQKFEFEFEFMAQDLDTAECLPNDKHQRPLTHQ